MTERREGPEGTAGTTAELIAELGMAISATRELLQAMPNPSLERVLVELEDLRARIGASELLTPEYRRTLAFDVLAVRELDVVGDPWADYLELLSNIAAKISEPDCTTSRNR